MEDYQSLKRRMEDVEDSMECSACFTVPRQLPIPCCPSGHLICGTCRGKVKGKCPTCRRKLRKGDVNSLAAALYDKVEHRCKFFPCEEKALLADILVHELKCKDRIIKCPGHNSGGGICGKEVKYRNFIEHCKRGDCFMRDTDSISLCMKLIWRELYTSQMDNFPDFFMAFRMHKIVFLFVKYENSNKMFRAFVSMAEDPEVTSQCTATISFSGLGQMFYENAHKFVYETKIVPLDDSFNNIKENFDKGVKIHIQTLMKAFVPFMMKEQGRRVKVGFDIQVKLMNNA